MHDGDETFAPVTIGDLAAEGRLCGATAAQCEVVSAPARCRTNHFDTISLPEKSKNLWDDHAATVDAIDPEPFALAR